MYVYIYIYIYIYIYTYTHTHILYTWKVMRELRECHLHVKSCICTCVFLLLQQRLYVWDKVVGKRKKI
jgi:hypothetical protein